MSNLKRFIKKEDGSALSFVILALSILIVSIASTTALLSIENSKLNNLTHEGFRNEELNMSCLQETLLKLKFDSNYTGGRITLEPGECDIQVDGTSDLRHIIVKSYIDNLTLETTTEVNLGTSPIKINYTKRGSL